MTQCPACSADVPPGAKFCMECGAPQLQACASCGTALPAGAKFCVECGTPVAGATSNPSPAAPAAASLPAPVAQRRLVSVLFADLVGFTTLSEHRDPEEVRELLSHYFDRA